MALVTKSITIPFEAGLSQKEDAIWLEAGSSAKAQNLVRLKTRSLAKRLGLTALPTAAQITGLVNPSVTISSGRRLGSIRGNPLLIARDSWTDGVFSYDEVASDWSLHDRVPEVYLYPYEALTNSASLNSPAAATFQMDTAVSANGYELLVWTDATGQGGTWGWCVRNAATGAYIARPQMYRDGQIPGVAIDLVKCIAVGNAFIVTWSTANASFLNVYAQFIDVSTPAVNVFPGNKQRLNTQANDSVNNLNAAVVNPYDVCPVIGDATKFALIYEATRTGTRTIRIIVFNFPGNVVGVVSDTAIDSVDTAWTTDNGVSAANSQLTALALRVDSGNSEAAYTYGWRSSTTTHVSTGIRNYTAMTNKSTPVDLMGTVTATMSATTDLAPSIVTLERNASSGNYTIRFSPQGASLDQHSTALPYIASWIAGNVAGTMTIAANQPRWTFGLSLYSRDFVQNGISYLVAQLFSTTQGSFFLMADDAWNDLTTGDNNGVTSASSFPLRTVGHIAPRLSNPLTTAGSPPTTKQSRVAPHFIANAFAAGVTIAQTAFPLATTASLTVPATIRADFNSPLLHQFAELGQNALIASGAPGAFDGGAAYELAFPYYPVITAITIAGGGSLSAGTYNWIAIFEWTDQRGQRHFSARSAPFTVTGVGANSQATIKVSCINISSKTKGYLIAPTGDQTTGPQGPLTAFTRMQQVQVKVYRTQVGGSSYNNILANDAPSAANLPGGPTVTVTDGASDASILPNTLLYGDGKDGTGPTDILDNNCAPAFQAGIVHQNRYFGVDGPRIWPSKAFTTGEGTGFNEAVNFSVDDGPGPVVALASLDDKLVLFKSDRLFYMTGLGPADNGTSNDWSPPQRIASDVGAIDWRSVVVTKDGVYFQSPVGRKLLTRDLQVTPVPIVEDVDAANPVVTSALVHPTKGEVRWTQNTDDTTSPRVGALVVANYVVPTWSTQVVNDNAGHATVGIISAVVANAQLAAGPPPTIAPAYYALRADGTVMRELVVTGAGSSEDLFTSGGGRIFVPMGWTSPWIKSDGLLGWTAWGAIRIFTNVADPAQMQIVISYDYGSGPVSDPAITFSATAIAAFTFKGLFEVRPKKDRAAAIQISISDASDAGTSTGAGFVLEGIRVDYQVDDTFGYRAPSGQRGAAAT